MRGTPISYLDFRGGRNTQNAPYLLSETECREQLNVHTSLSGDIEKREGFVTHSGETLTGEPVKATLVHTLFPANTTTKSLLGVVRTATTDSIVKVTTGSVASVLKTGLTANKRWHWAQADVNAGEGPIFGLNGVDTPQRWDGASAETKNWVATTGEVPKKAKYLTYFMSRLWCLEGSRLRFSGLTGSTPDPLSWPVENFVDLDPNDGQEGTGIGIVGSFLVVTKSRKTYVVYDPVTAANRMISNQVGCVAHRSIVQTPAGLLFLSEDQGICQTNGETVKPFSQQVEPDLNKVASHPETQALAAGVLEGSRYQLSLSLEGVRNDHTLEYDLENQSWWMHSCASNQFALLDPEGTPTLYSADSLASARVSKAFVSETYADNGAVYSGGSYWISPWRAWATNGKNIDPHVNKRINEIRADGVGNWRTFLARNFEEEFEEIDGEVWEAVEETENYFGEGSGKFGEGETKFGGVSQNTPIDLRYYTPAAPARAYSIKFLDESTTNFKINSATFLITPRAD